MKLSIIIPTFNNLEFLECTLNSITKNSKYIHEIIIHINDGSDGTLEYIKNKKIKFSHSAENIGLCKSVNLASKLISTNHILYAHDDMFFCKNWDFYLEKEIIKYKDNLYYLTGTNVSVNKGLINYDCGSSPKNFEEQKFNDFCNNDTSKDLQGSHWAPHLIHKDIWSKVGGFSEEFNPGIASDPDFNMKLWNEGVRIFKGLNDFKVYHFSSLTTRKKKNFIQNRGDKTFLKKWGFSTKFFKKYYLKSKTKYEGPLNEPKKTFNYFLDLLICKIRLFLT